MVPKAMEAGGEARGPGPHSRSVGALRADLNEPNASARVEPTARELTQQPNATVVEGRVLSTEPEKLASPCSPPFGRALWVNPPPSLLYWILMSVLTTLRPSPLSNPHPPPPVDCVLDLDVRPAEGWRTLDFTPNPENGRPRRQEVQ